MNYYPTANISLKTIIRECCTNKDLQDDIFLIFRMKNRENIHEIFKYKKFNYDFTDYLTCYTKKDQVVGFIRPCYDEFLGCISLFLNAKISNLKDDRNLTRALEERIERLKEVKSIQELEIEFPYLYRDLVEGRRYIKAVEKGKRTTPEEQYEKERHYYYSCALKQRLDRFIETQVELYKRFLERREDYKKLIEKKDYNRIIRKYFDVDKITMYVVHTYLTICENTSDLKTINYYIHFIENYESSNYNKDVSFTTDEKERIDRENIERRIKEIKRKQKEKDHIIEWELIPEGKDYKKVSKEKKASIKETLWNYKQLEKLRRIGETKKAFYENTPYIGRVVGTTKYRGYIAYIYGNGEVLLDKEYNPDKPVSAKGNAIYNIKAVDFETLSGLDKSVLRRHPKVGRIIHSKNWEKKAETIIKKEGTKEEQEESKKLIKRLENGKKDRSKIKKNR